MTLPPAALSALKEIAALAQNIEQDDALHQAARDWIVGRLPTLIYISDYPELDGHQDLAEYTQRKKTGNLKPSDLEFEKLMKVAGLNAATLHSLLDSDHERRQQLANRAGPSRFASSCTLSQFFATRMYLRASSKLRPTKLMRSHPSHAP